ncbi:hypothetical protein HK102_014135 [Quaeritorhiza haematococci]|nr:hypothetical protein HK102_014135 [Quaeritorhiza haematococci]
MADFIVEPAPPFYFVFSTPLTDTAIGVIIRIAADGLITTALILTSLLRLDEPQTFADLGDGGVESIQFQFKSGQAGLISAARTAMRRTNSAPHSKKKKRASLSILESGLSPPNTLISVPACELAESVLANVTSGIVILGGEAIAGSLQDPVAYLAQVSFPSYSTRFGGTLNDSLCMGIGSVCESKDLCQYHTLCAKFDTTCTARPSSTTQAGSDSWV